MASESTERNVRKSILLLNVKTLIARPQQAVTKGTPKGAENMIWESAGFIMDVLTNI